ncbi:BrnA antitoxin family protein [Cognatishimia sp. MH4019]|uniref:BrnA antitoxin family protein n=1 Tax=Cognatishimia sp. MH4019 TaxID=2854030 RepID=UPI001CD2358A|nr:BrnA antitoxin family protein [Cognatishimia sp. MH4019]
MARDPKEMTKAERVKASLMSDAFAMIERDVLAAVVLENGLPDAWHEVATQPCHEKSKVTIRLDSDVVKFFRAMGPGYQTKMNRLLRAWMDGRLAKVIKGPDATDIVLRPDIVAQEARRGIPWGQMADQVERMRLEAEQAAYQELTDEDVAEDEAYAPELRAAAKRRIKARKKAAGL